MFTEVEPMKCSVVITTIKERRLDVIELLLRLSSQSEKSFEVVVVCDEDIPITDEIHQKYAERGLKLKIITVPTGLTLGATRNIGVMSAEAQYSIFIDDDALPSNSSWLTEMRNSLEAGIDIVGGVSEPLFEPGFQTPIWWDEILLGPYVAVGNQYVKYVPDSIWGCNFSIRSSLVNDIGFFNENLGLRKYGPKLLYEDSEFVKRATKKGFSVQLNKSAVVYHKLNSRRINLASFKLRALRAGLTWRELIKTDNSYSNQAFVKEIFLKLVRSLYFVLKRKSKAVTLPVFVILLEHEVIGWLGVSPE